MFNLNFGVISTLILSIILYLLGNFIKSKISVLENLSIPTPIIGGILFALFVFILENFNILKFHADTSLIPYFLSIFFVSTGLLIDISSIKMGSKLVFIYWILCAILGFCQNIIAIFISQLLDINPLLGFMCGSVSMEGGHGYSVAFGNTLENMGIENATTAGILSATLGLIFGGILGGPVGRYLIKKYNLKPFDKNSKFHNKILNNKIKHKSQKICITTFFENILVLLLILNISFYISDLMLINTNKSIPDIVIGMFLSIFLTNFNSKLKISKKVEFIKFDYNFLNLIQEISLGFFLTMSLMNIKFSSKSMSFVLITVFFQIAFVLFYSIFICFKMLGKNYNAAIMVSGLIGHTLGATPNALSNMNTLTKKYGESQIAIFVVPIVSSFLLDIFSIPCILFFINFLS